MPEEMRRYRLLVELQQIERDARQRKGCSHIAWVHETVIFGSIVW